MPGSPKADPNSNLASLPQSERLAITSIAFHYIILNLSVVANGQFHCGIVGKTGSATYFLLYPTPKLKLSEFEIPKVFRKRCKV
jgi:hypothetical protein